MKKLKYIGLTIIIFLISLTIANARTIRNNGLGDIYININQEPYTLKAYTDGKYIQYTEVGCTWFVQARAAEITGKTSAYQGQDSMTVYGGYKWWYENDAANFFGATKGNTPIAPAVIAWGGHVAILEKIEGSTAYISEGGVNPAGGGTDENGYTHIRSVDVNSIQSLNPDFYGYIYLKPQWYSSYKLNDYGDLFYGQLIVNKNWINAINTGSSVTLGTKTNNTVNDVWIFRKQSDGSYTIQNAETKLYLDVQNFNDYDGAPVNTAGYNGSNAQKWFIYGPGSGSYMLRPASSIERVLTVSGNISIGSKLVLSTHKDNDYQRFAIWAMNGAGKTTLSYNIGSTTTLSWTKATDTTKYNINIEKQNSNGTYETYKNIMDITNTSYSIDLPKGNYSVAVMPTNGYSYTTSNVVKFTINTDQSSTTPSTQKSIQNCQYYYNETLLKDGNILPEIKTFSYTGKEIKPSITIKDGNKTLVEKTDYTISYESNIKIGTGFIYIYGKGNYNGTNAVLFKIVKGTYNISNVKFNNTNITYDGKQHFITASNLPAGVSVKFENNGKTNVGTYTVKVIFTSNDSNYNNIPSKNITLKINPKSISKLSITNPSNKIYTGNNIIQNLIVKDGNTILKNGTDYTINHKNNKNVGTATITITGKGNYNGTVIKTFKITNKAISSTNITGIVNKTYTGKNQTQNIIIKYGNITLKNGTDYTITYKNNKNVGTATITITGKGNYNGKVNKTFNINPNGTTIKSITRGSKRFTVKWKKNTKQTTGYEIQYSTNKSFSNNNKTIRITKNKTTSKKVTKLKKKTIYYIRVRTYKIVNNKKYYSNWSPIEYIKTKYRSKKASYFV